MAELAPLARQRFLDANGEPLALGKLYVYEAGSSTPKTTYTERSAAPGTENTNPIILDADGWCDLWIESGYYKLVLKDANDVTIWTKDDISLPSEAALASAFYRGIIYLTFTDSPYTLDQDQNGYLLSCNTTSGTIVINLPEISAVTLPYNVCVKKSSGSNNVTINRAGTDTIDTATSKSLTTSNAAAHLIASIGQSPDDWASIDMGTVADASVTKAKLATDARDYSVASKSNVDNNTSISYTNDLILVDTTTAFSMYMFSASSGYKPIKIKKISDDFNAFTLARTGSDTFRETAASETSTTLNTRGEQITIVANSTSSFEIIDRVIPSPWVLYGVIPVSATTTAPTKGSGVTTDKLWYRREGRNLRVRYAYCQTNSAGATSGTGDYLFGIPTSLVIDTTYEFLNNSTVGAGAQDRPGIVGHGWGAHAGTTSGVGNVRLYSSSYVRIFCNTAASGDPKVIGQAAAHYQPTHASGVNWGADFVVPISGWKG